MEIRIKKQTLTLMLFGILFILIGIVVIQANLFETSSLTSNAASHGINLWAIFLTGLLTGGLTCLAVQGGLLAATIAQREEEKLLKKTTHFDNALPIVAFLAAKLVAYTILGFLLGLFGSLFQLSLAAQIVMQLAVAVFMLGTAFNILNVHPIFRYFVIQPPKSLTRLVRNQSKSKSLFAPMLLGAFTIFIPCGTTQAMMALAIGSASPLLGALVLFAFILGTSPLFFILGYFATKLGESLHRKFMKFAAFTLILLALFTINNVLSLTGSLWTISSIFTSTSETNQSAASAMPQKDVVISIESSGYTPSVVSVKAGSTISLTLKNNGAYTCASAFTIPYFNYQKVVPVGKTEQLTLKMPDKSTQIPFMCSMGMYKGVINVL